MNFLKKIFKNEEKIRLEKVTSERKQAEEIACKEREDKERKRSEEKARWEQDTREKKLAEDRASQEVEAGKMAENPAGIEWIKIPAGEFTMGSNDYSNEKPPRKVYLDEYLMAKTPVTNAQFKKFIDAGGYKNKEYWSDTGWNWLTGENSTQLGDWDNEKWNTPSQPVVGVSWYEAKAFSKWANCRLPSEAEWEKAARGPSTGSGTGHKYPWGNEKPNKNLANFNNNIGKTTLVGKYSPAGDSPYGCVDMAGNVWEWCVDWFDVYPGGDINASGDFGEKYKVLRGGSWSNYENDLRSAARSRLDPTYAYYNFGFRCSRSRL